MAKAETWETSDKNIRCLFDSKTAFTETKTRGAGREAILKFLGGNWKQWMIQNALAIFKDEEEGTVDREAVEQMPSMRSAEEFRKAVKSTHVPRAKTARAHVGGLEREKLRHRGLGRAYGLLRGSWAHPGPALRVL